MKLSAYAKQLGISYQTAWRMWQRGELPAHQLPSGTVIVDVPPSPPAVRLHKVAVYARVSSAENRKHLESQADRVAAFCAAKGWPVAQVVKECGSGVNEAQDGQEDLMQDFVALITSFTARLYGRRRASRKRTQLLATLEVN
jgi:putative resolvase